MGTRELEEKRKREKKEKTPLFVFLRHTQAVMCMCVWRRSAKEQPVGWRGAGIVDVTVLKSLNM